MRHPAKGLAQKEVFFLNAKKSGHWVGSLNPLHISHLSQRFGQKKTLISARIYRFLPKTWKGTFSFQKKNKRTITEAPCFSLVHLSLTTTWIESQKTLSQSLYPDGILPSNDALCPLETLISLLLKLSYNSWMNTKKNIFASLHNLTSRQLLVRISDCHSRRSLTRSLFLV